MKYILIIYCLLITLLIGIGSYKRSAMKLTIYTPVNQYVIYGNTIEIIDSLGVKIVTKYSEEYITSLQLSLMIQQDYAKQY